MATAAEMIARAVQTRIESGELGVGELVPSARALARVHRVALATASRAQALLRDGGWADPVPGVGLVVRRREAARPAGPLALAVIIARATAIADAEGLDAVSMRRLAAELGTTPTGLYRHIDDKQDLVLRMVDAALAQWRPPARGDAPWRECLEAGARTLWRQFQRHPWLAPALSMTRPAALPGGAAWTEWMLEVLAEPVPALGARFDTYLVVFGHIRGLALNLEAEQSAAAATGQGVDDFVEAELPALRAMTDPGEYPHFAQLVRSEYDFSLDALFDRGLTLLIDGIAASAG